MALDATILAAKEAPDAKEQAALCQASFGTGIATPETLTQEDAMCEEVTSSCLLPILSPLPLDGDSTMDTFVGAFDPLCCFHTPHAEDTASTTVIITTTLTPSALATVSPLSKFETEHFCSEGYRFSADGEYAKELAELCEEAVVYQSCISTVEDASVCAGEATAGQLGTNTQKTTHASRKRSRTSYKHVPHRDKPVLAVERRNERERRRVQSVNSAFVRLRRALPQHVVLGRGKRVSKVKTLQAAMQYIWTMQQLLARSDGGVAG